MAVAFYNYYNNFNTEMYHFPSNINTSLLPQKNKKTNTSHITQNHSSGNVLLLIICIFHILTIAYILSFLFENILSIILCGLRLNHESFKGKEKRIYCF